MLDTKKDVTYALWRPDRLCCDANVHRGIITRSLRCVVIGNIERYCGIE